MRYGKIDGPIMCRYAKTAPIINSVMAREVGVQAPLGYRPEYGIHIDVGRNVKLRMMVGDRRHRITCHARIDWMREDPDSGEHMIGFSELSLSDTEFKVLMDSFTDEEVPNVAFGDSVRETTSQAIPLPASSLEQEELVRDKAVTMPVSLIDLIDDKRGNVPFSEFVVTTLSDRLATLR